MHSRPATTDDIDAVTTTIELAFRADPVWGPALGRPDGSTKHLHDYWRLYVEGAVENGTAFLTSDASAAAVWVPPGAIELTDSRQAALSELVASNLEPDAAALLVELWARFTQAHAREDPHAYLSLLATHPEHRGRGIGQELLAENLEMWDAQGLACYLESTNPANDHRYARAGFVPVGAFVAPLNSAPVTTMWRDARPPGRA